MFIIAGFDGNGNSVAKKDDKMATLLPKIVLGVCVDQ
jgi:hypothetical protein